MIIPLIQPTETAEQGDYLSDYTGGMKHISKGKRHALSFCFISAGRRIFAALTVIKAAITGSQTGLAKDNGPAGWQAYALF